MSWAEIGKLLNTDFSKPLDELLNDVETGVSISQDALMTAVTTIGKSKSVTFTENAIWTVPSGVDAIRLTAIAAGNAGSGGGSGIDHAGGAGGAGGAAGQCIKSQLFSGLTPGIGISITVGVGNTIIGSLATLTKGGGVHGGTGGSGASGGSTQGTACAGGPGGVGTDSSGNGNNGSNNIGHPTYEHGGGGGAGGAGAPGVFNVATVACYPPGNGGNGFGWSSPVAQPGGNATAVPTWDFGAGGGGGGGGGGSSDLPSNPGAGGSGASGKPGVVIIEWD